MPLFLKIIKPYKYLLLVWLLILLANQGICQTQPEQRYNRFQYHRYHWRAYHSKKYHLYFSQGCDSLAAHIGRKMPTATAQLKKNLASALVDEPNIIIYPSIDQQYETNIGSYDNQQYTLPTFITKGNRIVLAYNGSYEDLDEQLYEALARAIWEQQFNQNNVASQANSGTAATSDAQQTKAQSKSEPIPVWFKEGAIRYIAHRWPMAAEDALRASFQQKGFGSWKQVQSYEPKLSGQAFCYFLTQRYQSNTVSQLFNQLKSKKSLPRVARLVTKHTLDTLYKQCYNFYEQRFKKELKADSNKKPEGYTIPHEEGIVQRLLISPGQDYIAYVLYAANKRMVYVYNTKTRQAKRIASYELAPWIDDHKADLYPLIQWHPDDRQLFVAKPDKGRINISRYGIDGIKAETIYLYGVDGITSMQPLSDDQFVFTAFRQGESDIIGYDDRKRYQYHPYTEDVYDDSQPIMALGKNPSLQYYLSDRPKKEMPRVYAIGAKPKKVTLWQGIYAIKENQAIPFLVDTLPYVRYDKPTLLDGDRLLFTDTRTGAERFATSIINDAANIKSYGYAATIQYIAKSKEVATYKSNKDSIYISAQPVDEWLRETASTDTSSQWLKEYRQRLTKERKDDSMLNAAKDTTHTFLSQILAPKKKDNKKGIHTKDGKDSVSTEGPQLYDPKKTTKYILQLQSAYFTAKVNNDYFINRYQPYLNYQGQFKFPEVGGMAQGGFTDLLENHHFTLAYRIPAGTEGSDFFAQYENTAQKTDWGLSYYRSVQSLQTPAGQLWIAPDGQPYPSNAKVKTHYYEANLSYPLSYDCAIGAQTAIRQDRTVFLATDRRSLDLDAIQSTWSITTLSFTMNKLQPTLPNLYKGFYIKAITDVFKGFSQDEAVLFGSGLNVAWHQPLYKYITLVTQAHIGYSGGNEKVLYNLGGEDNNVTPRVDTNVHFPQNAPYAFQTLVTPFRGYYQNTIYGNQYALLNADVYFPIFQTLIPLETPLPSINNLQLGIFTDVANAKETWNSANLNNSRWFESYGFSLRTMLAGYPLRLDVAWPTTKKAQSVWYFSLNLQ